LFAAFAIPSLSIKKEYKSIDTGDSYTDEMLISTIDNLEKIRLLRNAISNETVRKQIGILENDSLQIMEYIKTHPDKGIKISQFFLYYLPTTVKLINNYKELEKQEQVGVNHTTGMEKIEGFMKELVTAYHKVLDDLYEDKVMETLIDIKVMDEMLHMDKYVEESKPVL
jgi:5-bromo-4-chloroindolyl phosphate hydrolysis protein